MRKLLPIILALVGIGGGLGAGILLKPAAPEEVVTADGCAPPAGDAHAETAPAASHGEEGGEGEVDTAEYVKMSNQFVVPVIGENRISALVVVSLSLEVNAGTSSQVLQREPKLRDGFLQVLFDHANVGGFEGAFTQPNKLDPLRRILLTAARTSVGPIVKDVLITEINKQES
ncbi:flagellar basal body-associated FliL family protein [Puniceibacterium sediminis]|uniref:Flagellar protein FliL n=1 Tax=Puniceibacterium sediminis TaxID=1608407 RepID=A0A238WT89_9RHOB|nr:flagellar basal body-associated FliL family protein [Puniceibacterium sediminis]SNR49786.1 hypothetical protein SAMN06265370_10798 [Puniceibacterium sediminis]